LKDKNGSSYFLAAEFYISSNYSSGFTSPNGFILGGGNPPQIMMPF